MRQLHYVCYVLTTEGAESTELGGYLKIADLFQCLTALVGQAKNEAGSVITCMKGQSCMKRQLHCIRDDKIMMKRQLRFARYKVITFVTAWYEASLADEYFKRDSLMKFTLNLYVKLNQYLLTSKSLNPPLKLI